MKRKGPQRDVKKQRFWQGVVQQWRRSGRSIRDFCRTHALSEPSFYAWRRELTQRRQASRAARRTRAGSSTGRRAPGADKDRPGRAAFLPMRVVAAGPVQPTTAAADGDVEIVLDRQRTVRVRAGFDRQTLADVLAVLEARSC